MADVDSVWTRTNTGRLERRIEPSSSGASNRELAAGAPEVAECIICTEQVNTYHYCSNNHKTCLSCMEKHFLSECQKMNSQVAKYIIKEIDYIGKFQLVCCPLLRACDSNINEEFEVTSIIREPKISERTARIIVKTKQFVDRAVGHRIASSTMY